MSNPSFNGYIIFDTVSNILQNKNLFTTLTSDLCSVMDAFDDSSNEDEICYLKVTGMLPGLQMPATTVLHFLSSPSSFCAPCWCGPFDITGCEKTIYCCYWGNERKNERIMMKYVVGMPYFSFVGCNVGCFLFWRCLLFIGAYSKPRRSKNTCHVAIYSIKTFLV